MSSNNVVQLTSLSLQEKAEIILETVFGDHVDEVFNLVLNGKTKAGKIILPICQTLAGLVNVPPPFPVKVEVLETKVIIHF